MDNDEDKSNEKLSDVSKSPDNKPVTRKWARTVFTLVMRIFAILAFAKRLISMIGRFVAWFREMSDSS